MSRREGAATNASGISCRNISGRHKLQTIVGQVPGCITAGLGIRLEFTGGYVFSRAPVLRSWALDRQGAVSGERAAAREGLPVATTDSWVEKRVFGPLDF
jgi:hypothetical protein